MSIELDKKIINAKEKACLFEIREEVLVTEAIKKTTCAGFQREVSGGGFDTLREDSH